MWVLLQQLGRVPRRLIWDNESGIGRGKRHAEGVGAFTGTLATSLQRLKPYDPESKGLVERRNGFFETSFMPGRDFASPGDFNTQFVEWLGKANARIVRTIKTRPVDRLDADRAAMLRLPPVAPVVGWVNRVRLGRDYYVRIDSSDYSVDPAVIGRFVDVHGDLARVEVRHEGRLVATHDRVWARGMTITDPVHVAAAKVLREQFQQPRLASDPHDGLVRDLADYDRAFGLIDATLTDGEVA
jgi:transposase